MPNTEKRTPFFDPRIYTNLHESERRYQKADRHSFHFSLPQMYTDAEGPVGSETESPRPAFAYGAVMARYRVHPPGGSSKEEMIQIDNQRTLLFCRTFKNGAGNYLKSSWILKPEYRPLLLRNLS